MQAHICTVCGFVYDLQSADRDVEGNLIQFDTLDPDWQCPVCGVRLDLFKPIESENLPDVPVTEDKKRI
ncbi:MAG: rubredoxin [Candidatus Babeliales bacterium]|jgi:rubredoxin